MSNPAPLGAIVYEAEAVHGENVSTFGTFRLPIIGPPDMSGLKHDKMDSLRAVQLLNEGTPWILGAQGGSFKTKFYLPGHGSSTAGATTIGLLETLLGRIFGAVALSAASGTTATGGTALVPLVTSSGAYTAGSLCPVGVLNDARGNGQTAAIASNTTTTLTLLTGLDGAPNAADVVGSAVNVSTLETSYAMPSNRFLIQTANLQYEAHGCYPTDAVLSGLNPNGEKPTLEVTWAVSWWQYNTAIAFPSVAATEQFNPAPNAAGSLFVNDVGTVTRVTRKCRSFSIAFKLGVVALEGPGGASQYQTCVGARRVPNDIRISWTEDIDAQTLTPVVPGFGTGTTSKHVLYTLNAVNGTRIAFYFPQVRVTTVGVQKIDGTINRVQFDGECNSGPTTTTDLTASAMRFAFM